MEGVFGVFNIPLGESIKKGKVEISTYEFLSKNNPLYNLRSLFDDGGLTRMADGKYVRLIVDNELMMSDTQMEKRSNQAFVMHAHGRVLIAGLGIGLILHNLITPTKDPYEICKGGGSSITSGKITEVIVIEKSQDLIDLVSPYFKHDKIKIIQGDIFEWKPNKGEKFNTIYFDIWPDINTDNLEEIRKLHNRFKGFVDRADPLHWMNSWMKEFLQAEKRREQREEQSCRYW